MAASPSEVDEEILEFSIICLYFARPRLKFYSALDEYSIYEILSELWWSREVYASVARLPEPSDPPLDIPTDAVLIADGDLEFIETETPAGHRVDDLGGDAMRLFPRKSERAREVPRRFEARQIAVMAEVQDVLTALRGIGC